MLKTILEMKNIYKLFDENIILQDVNFELLDGEVHAIVGENGSGKSTLMNILAGIYQMNSGSIVLNGKQTNVNNPNHARELGISIIFQDYTLLKNMNIAENVFLNQEYFYRLGFVNVINWKKVYSKTREVLEYLNLDVDPALPINKITIGAQKMVEIARAIVNKTKILIMDEPTASMNEHEVDFLFKIIRNLKSLGISVIYISHRLNEIRQIADRVTVLRDGESIATRNVEEIDSDKLIKMIIGDEIKDRYPKIDVKIGKEVLSVKSLSCRNILKDVSFSLHKGEIIGISGLKGSGKVTLAKVLFGIERKSKGNIYINAKKVEIKNSEDAVKSGLCYVTPNRLVEGLIPNMAIKYNILMANFKGVVRRILLSNIMIKKEANNYFDMLGIKGASIDQHVRYLSGGNQKKVILAKWLYKNSKIFILNEPTSGIDICSKIDIYNILNGLVRSGASMILISSEIPELLGFCDRILVMYKGSIVKEFLKGETNQEEILFYSSGEQK